MTETSSEAVAATQAADKNLDLYSFAIREWNGHVEIASVGTSGTS